MNLTFSHDDFHAITLAENAFHTKNEIPPVLAELDVEKMYLLLATYITTHLLPLVITWSLCIRHAHELIT